MYPFPGGKIAFSGDAVSTGTFFCLVEAKLVRVKPLELGKVVLVLLFGVGLVGEPGKKH